MKDRFDVVVVGAGPVGLLTAVELVLGGAHVLVLERLAAPSAVLKAGGVGALGIEALRRRGMAATIDAAQARGFGGHFAGLMLIRPEAQREPDRVGRVVDQQAVEAMLADRARSLGIEVRRECEVAGLVQRADGVDVRWASPSGTGQTRCSWLVGCDGGRSGIRKMVGFAFPGCDPTMTMYQTVAEIDHPERLQAHGFRYTSGGMYCLYGGRLILMDFSGPPNDRSAPVTHDEIEGVLRRVSGADVRIKTFENASRWTDNTRLVDTYRRGRVFLAGDAAHIHSPFGGQGMSLGLVDAQNLGWKLAAVVRGEMPERLLDTYTAERRPVAEAVLANTLAQMAIMRPDPQSSAMRDLVARLLQVDAANRFFGDMMSSLSTRYDLGSVRDEVGRMIGDRSIDGGSLYDLMQDGGGVCLDASGGGTISEVVAVAGTERLRCVAVARGPSMLIRPDGCVAWVGEGACTDGFSDALRRWFGPTQGDVPSAMRMPIPHDTIPIQRTAFRS